MVKTATNQNGDRSKRRHQNGDKTGMVKTATSQNGDKPKRRQDKRRASQNGDRNFFVVKVLVKRTMMIFSSCTAPN